MQDCKKGVGKVKFMTDILQNTDYFARKMASWMTSAYGCDIMIKLSFCVDLLWKKDSENDWKWNDRMRKKGIFIMFAAGMLLAAGCGSKTDAASTGQMAKNVETSVVEEGFTEKETLSGEAAEEIVVEGNNGIIYVGTTGSPYSELLTQARIQLAKKGWDLQVETYSDYNKINQDVLGGKLDAHLFAHQTYIDSYNDVNGTELVPAATICFEKHGIYSLLNEELTNLASGAKIAIPEDDTRKAKALLFLQSAGYITLKENVGLTAIMEDITENPKNIEFVTYTMDNVKDILKTADYCIMGADTAILAGLEPKKEVLKEETAASDSARAMAALLVTTQEKVESEQMRLLEQALKSDETKKYVEDTYKGALGLFP